MYVIFKGGFIGILGKTLKYVWSSTLPVGTMVKSPYSGSTMIFVIKSGTAGLDAWGCEKRDVYEDYVKAFGSQPPLIRGIAIMTDADNTKSSAWADYDDFFMTKR